MPHVLILLMLLIRFRGSLVNKWWLLFFLYLPLAVIAQGFDSETNSKGYDLAGAGCSVYSPLRRFVSGASQQVEKTSIDIKSEFYTTYIEKFYPRAFVIRKYFIEGATIDQVTQALADLLKVIGEVPWFYVANTNKRFKIRDYWEFFDDQLVIFDDYFKRAYVEKATKKVFTRTAQELLALRRSKGYFEFMRKNQSFLGYCNQHRIEIIKAFYALRFDFTIKFFNEAVLFKDYKPAQNLLRQLERFVARLEGSVYEARYRNSFVVAQQLLAILRQELAVQGKGLSAQLDHLEE